MRSYMGFLVVVLAIGAGVWYSTRQMTSDPGQVVGLVFGNETDQSIEMHLVVTMIMSRVEGPRVKIANTVIIQSWDGWITDHFQLTDPEGQAVTLRRQQNSNLMKGTRGTPDFFLAADLTPETQYTLEYVPRVADGNRYRYTFTAPTELTAFKRYTFEPVVQE